MSYPFDMLNKNTFEKKEIVKEYVVSFELLKPEETILNKFKNNLKNMKMLDIGVGGGRTTYFFMNLTKEYIGIDYSQNMVKAINERYANPPANVSFKMCDVRSMNIFESNYFDFILFSYNGIDYMCHEDRLKALQEIKRVCRKGGVICFSTHNLQRIKTLFKLQLSLNPKKIVKGIHRYILLRYNNPSPKILKNRPYAIINDGAYQFQLNTYYIKPKEQIRQLQNLGMKNIKVYSWLDGKEITEEYKLDIIVDSSLYYLCTI